MGLISDLELSRAFSDVYSVLMKRIGEKGFME